MPYPALRAMPQSSSRQVNPSEKAGQDSTESRSLETSASLGELHTGSTTRSAAGKKGNAIIHRPSNEGTSDCNLKERRIMDTPKPRIADYSGYQPRRQLEDEGSTTEASPEENISKKIRRGGAHKRHSLYRRR